MNFNKKKIAIITANVGGIDNAQGFPNQNLHDKYEFDFYYYHENNLPFPLINLDNRLKSKYVKIQTHRFLPQYDMYIWIDGRVKIKTKDFLMIFDEALNTNDITMFKHKERDNVYDEMNYILDTIKKGNHYLLSRYGNQCMDKELEFYERENLPKDFPLYACTIFARWNNEKLNNAFDEWWRRCIEFSYFDQTMFSYVANKYDLKINPLDWLDFEKVLSVNKHK